MRQYVLVIFLIVVCSLEVNLTMADEAISPAEKRRNFAMQVFKDFPGKITPEIQEKILAQQVVLGMAPYEAYLTAGAFAFKVTADSSKWKPETDPYKVMWAQSLHPDDSQIWMTFENDTQYLGEGKQTFRVYFRGGKALEIEKIAR